MPEYKIVAGWDDGHVYVRVDSAAPQNVHRAVNAIRAALKPYVHPTDGDVDAGNREIERVSAQAATENGVRIEYQGGDGALLEGIVTAN